MVKKKSRWIQKALDSKKKNRGKGTLTRQANRHGMTVAQFAAHVKAHPNRFSKLTHQRVNFYRSLRRFSRSRKRRSPSRKRRSPSRKRRSRRPSRKRRRRSRSRR